MLIQPGFEKSLLVQAELIYFVGYLEKHVYIFSCYINEYEMSIINIYIM